MADISPLLFTGFFAALCLFCGCLALSDFRHGIIPDVLNFAVGGLGLAQALMAGGAIAAVEVVTEAIIVGLVFWLFRQLYFTVRKIQGLGLGDVKFLAAATLWIGLKGIPMLVLTATLSALIVVSGAHLAGHNLTRRTSLPFGPFLALGLLAAVGAQRWFGLL